MKLFRKEVNFIKKILSGLLAIILLALNTTSVLAHVTVSPTEVETEEYYTFIVGAPTHGETPVSEIRIVIPEGVTNVTPTVKTGWDITVVRDGQHIMPDGTVMDDNAHAMGEHDAAAHHGAPVREIIWTGGIVPSEQRDEFSFSAKTPKDETTLYWKAYQTFTDGKVVSWELTPGEEYPKTDEGEDDVERFGPASETRVINAEAQAAAEKETLVASTSQNSNNALVISVIAVILAGAAIALQFMKKK